MNRADRQFVEDVAKWRIKRIRDQKLEEAVRRYRDNPITENKFKMFDLLDKNS